VQDIDLSAIWHVSFGTISNSLSYNKGTNWLGARDDNYNSKEIDHETIPKLQFEKWIYDINMACYFSDRSYSINSNYHKQYTKDYLYNNDQLIVGSWSSVRGYSSSNLYGDNGWYITNNFTKIFQLTSLPSVLQTISPYIGLDYGAIECHNNNSQNCGEIHGGSIGFQTQGKYLNSSFKIARPFKTIDNNTKKENKYLYNITMVF
jgi:hemolysin activation/secretion protein